MTREQSLSAIPMSAPVLARVPLPDGGLKLTISVPTRPLQRKLLRLPAQINKDFELDAFGCEIFTWCNGRNTVGDLLRLFSEKYRINRHESEKAVLTFLRTLTARGLIVLVIPDDPPHPQSGR